MNREHSLGKGGERPSWKSFLLDGESDGTESGQDGSL